MLEEESCEWVAEFAQLLEWIGTAQNAADTEELEGF
jgi:hypothetical protein